MSAFPAYVGQAVWTRGVAGDGVGAGFGSGTGVTVGRLGSGLDGQGGASGSSGLDNENSRPPDIAGALMYDVSSIRAQ